MTVISPMVEMGQGTYTSLPMLVAEELDVDMSDVGVEHSPPNDKLYGNAFLGGVQMTGNSSSIRGFYLPLRQAGAAARAMLIAAAATKLGVDAGALTTEPGYVVARGRRAARSPTASWPMPRRSCPFPTNVKLKDPSTFRIIGTPAKRLDVAGKVNGTAVYGIDVKVPGMKIATVAASPVFGGTLASFDDAAALKVPGVHQVAKLDNAVAVIADHYWAAKQGLEAGAAKFDDGPHAALSTADVVAALAKAAENAGRRRQERGRRDRPRWPSAATKVEAVYEEPFLAHATMEPINCTVQVTPDGCDIWVGTQIPTVAQQAVAKTLGLKPEQVRIHNHLLGGGFGRRLEFDFIVQAALIAKQSKDPVKVVWSREEDIQHDMYRPYYYDRISAGLDAQRQARRLEPPHRRLLDHGAVLPARCSRTASTPTPSMARSTCPTTFPTSTSNTCARSRRAFRPRSGAASARRTTSTWSRASSTSWRRWRRRIPSSIAARCSAKNPRALHVLEPRRRNVPAGARRSGRAKRPRRIACTTRSAATWRRSPR